MTIRTAAGNLREISVALNRTSNRRTGEPVTIELDSIVLGSIYRDNFRTLLHAAALINGVDYDLDEKRGFTKSTFTNVRITGGEDALRSIIELLLDYGVR